MTAFFRAVGGARLGQVAITGDDYLEALSYGHGHVWRNFGIILAWCILFVVLSPYLHDLEMAPRLRGRPRHC